MLKRLDGCVAYQDHILLFVVTDAELRKRDNAVKEWSAAKNFTAKTRFIKELRHKDKFFEWTDESQRAFQSQVDELTCEPLVQPYTLDKEVTLSTNASEKTFDAVLTQNDHPVIYISPNLTSAEQKYSNIKREALAVVIAATRLRQFLLRRKFTLRTDHKPLQYIFNRAEKLRKEMQSDEFTKRMMNRIKASNWKNCTKMKKTSLKVSNALTVQNDLIYNGSRVFIPFTYRKQVIEKFHDVHRGINALKKMVRKNASWPFLDNDIEQFVENCPECSKNRSRLTDLPLNGKNALHGKDFIWTGFTKQNTVTF